MLNIKQRLIMLIGTTLLAAGIVGSGNVHAFNLHRADVDMIGAYAGNALLGQLLSPVESNCSAWHEPSDCSLGWTVPHI